jgi:hypothetical protein
MINKLELPGRMIHREKRVSNKANMHLAARDANPVLFVGPATRQTVGASESN